MMLHKHWRLLWTSNRSLFFDSTKSIVLCCSSLLLICLLDYLSIYMSTMIHNVFCFSTALLVATCTKSKLSTKRKLPSVCSMQSFFSRGRPGKSNKRWFAWLQCLMICDSILFGTHSMYLLASVYTCLHTWFYVSSLGRWEAGRIGRHLVQTVQTVAGQENDIFSPEEVGCCAVEHMPVFHPLDLFLDVRTID